MSCKNRELSYVKKSKSSVGLSPTIIEHIVVEEGTSSDLFEVGGEWGGVGASKGGGFLKRCDCTPFGYHDQPSLASLKLILRHVGFPKHFD